MTHTHLGEMIELIPIYAAAILLGLISGVAAVHHVTARPGRSSLRALMGLVALASPLCYLVAAKPADGQATVEFWALATAVMAALDLAASCIVEPWMVKSRYTERSLRRLRAWLLPGFVATLVVALAILKARFDLPLNHKFLTSFAAQLAGTLLALGALDVGVRLVIIGLGRRRGRHEMAVCPVEFLN